MINKKLKVNFPQKSLFGFKILNSLYSSLFAYFFIVLILFSKKFIGINKIQLIAGDLYKIISNLSFWILVINSYIKRKELDRNIYLLINLPLIGLLPFSLYLIIKHFFSIANV